MPSAARPDLQTAAWQSIPYPRNAFFRFPVPTPPLQPTISAHLDRPFRTIHKNDNPLLQKNRTTNPVSGHLQKLHTT
ncbi:MAG: hypothetical protein Q4A49_04515 [Neisseria sp.]|nr:hypothetical protein [Neisseria sp.]